MCNYWMRKLGYHLVCNTYHNIYNYIRVFQYSVASMEDTETVKAEQM